MPGTENALRALAERGDVIQSVLTGNTKPAAEIKLRTFGLDRYIDFDSGAYGTDDETRANLVKIARQHAEAAHGSSPLPAEATPRPNSLPREPIRSLKIAPRPTRR